MILVSNWPCICVPVCTPHSVCLCICISVCAACLSASFSVVSLSLYSQSICLPNHLSMSVHEPRRLSQPVQLRARVSPSISLSVSPYYCFAGYQTHRSPALSASISSAHN